MVDIEAIFEIFADNPPAILIACGFLSVFIGAGFHVANYVEVAEILYIFGLIGISAGIILQIIWLARR